jgi:hypothetical protein
LKRRFSDRGSLRSGEGGAGRGVAEGGARAQEARTGRTMSFWGP